MSEGSRTATRARDQLTARQREVIELLAAGKTNFEIAEALGVSLEGAKYHVSEILAKLGVESREEAVTAWQRGAQGPRWMRTKVWVPVAVCLVAAAVGLTILIPLLSDEDEPQAAVPGTWVAWVDDQQDGPDEKLPLHILTGSPLRPERTFDDRYHRAPHWSPDGQRLAVYSYASGDSQARLTVFRQPTWSRREIVVTAMGALAWSPDGKHLAHLGDHQITIYDQDLHVREVIKDLPEQNRPIHGLAVWSPDSKKFVAAFQGELIVVSIKGEVAVAELPHDDFATGNSFVGGFGRSSMYWDTNDAFVAISPPINGASPGDYERWTFRQDGASWKPVWKQSGPGFPESIPPGESEPGGFYQGMSADGTVSVFSDIRFTDEQLTTRVWTSQMPRLEFEVVDAGDPIAGLGAWFDIVVVRE